MFPTRGDVTFVDATFASPASHPFHARHVTKALGENQASKDPPVMNAAVGSIENLAFCAFKSAPAPIGSPP